jgi:hypothetical protein
MTESGKGAPPMRILYLVRGTPAEGRSEFKDRIITFTKEYLTPPADSVVVALTEEKPPALSIIPFRKDLFALISLDGVAADAPWPNPPSGFAGAYESEAEYPVVHERDWPPGERSPGAGLLTLFRRRISIREDEFLRRWFKGHTPLTLEVHPNVGYVRNRILGDFAKAGLPADARDVWDGIVEEQYDPPSDLLRPSRFFGGTLPKMIPTMIRVYKDVKGFIDYSSIRTWLTSEYRIK